MVGSEISWWFRNILPLGSGLIGMVPKYPAARARINRNGSDSSGSEISCDTGLYSRHAGRSCKIREFSFIIPLTLDTRTHTNMDRFNPFLHTEVDQFNPLTLTNLHYLHKL